MTVLLRVDCWSGAWAVPGPTQNMGRVRSYPIAPPSTIQGFLESLIGREGPLSWNYAYGWLRQPSAKGEILRTDHVWSSSGLKNDQRGEHTRPLVHERFYDFSLLVAVSGTREDEIRASLRGEVSRYGNLSLGTSEDLVSVSELDGITQPVEWVVPGNRMALPIRATKGYGNLNPQYRGFSFAIPGTCIPDTAWISR